MITQGMSFDYSILDWFFVAFGVVTGDYFVWPYVFRFDTWRNDIGEIETTPPTVTWPPGYPSSTGGSTNTNGGTVKVNNSPKVLPVVDFSYRIYASGLVAFTDKSLNNPYLFSWSFGDGAGSTSKNAYHQYASAGNKTVTLTAQSRDGVASKTVVVPVTILTENANFSYVRDSLDVHFTNTSTVFGTNFLWNFGDGSTSSEENPVHAFASAGNYNVTLTVGGVSKTIAVTVVVGWDDYTDWELLTGNITAEPNGGLIKTGPVDGVWDAAAVGTTSIPVFREGAGIKFLFSFSGYLVAAGLNLGSSLDWTTIDYAVMWDGTNYKIFENSSLKYTLAYPGATYYWEVKLNATGQIEYWHNGILQYTSLTMPTYPLSPNASLNKYMPGVPLVSQLVECIGLLSEPTFSAASFSVNVDSGTTPLTVNFTDTSSGNPTAWAWDFGDGTTSTSQNPSHIYTSGGTYSARLTTTSAFGTSTYIKSINVRDVAVTLAPFPVAAFTASAQIVLTSQVINFTDTSTGATPITWAWTFGDGTTSTSQNPNKSYGSEGVYTVSLTITDNSGFTSTATKVIIVTADVDPSDNAPIVTSATPSASTGIAPTTITFTATVSTPDIFYLWDFGDGATSTLAAPSHTYQQGGTYTVSLTVTNLYGSTTTTIRIIIVDLMFSDISVIGYYLIDKINHRILIFGTTGTLLSSFGGFGSTSGKFNKPTSILVNK